MDLHISFGKKVICTTVYVKLVAPDQLLLSEAVCFQLGIVSHHPSVQYVQGCYSAETPRPTRNGDCEGDTTPVINKRTVPVEQPRTVRIGTVSC